MSIELLWRWKPAARRNICHWVIKKLNRINKQTWKNNFYLIHTASVNSLCRGIQWNYAKAIDVGVWHRVTAFGKPALPAKQYHLGSPPSPLGFFTHASRITDHWTHVQVRTGKVNQENVDICWYLDSVTLWRNWNCGAANTPSLLATSRVYPRWQPCIHSC